MTQLANHPAYLRIEDRLDAVGQQVRLHRMASGAIKFVVATLSATWAAAGLVELLSRDGNGAGSAGYVIAAVWLASIVFAAIAWIVRPMILRPRAIDVARLVESRVDGLHNGLTNALLLARREDIAANPWSPDVLDEIATRTLAQPLGTAVRWADVRRTAIRGGLILLPMLVVLIFAGSSFARGFRQMLHPTAFVPMDGEAQIISVDPGNVTRVASQPLEVTVVAKTLTQATPDAKLFFDKDLPATPLAPSPRGDDGLTHFTARVDHIDHSVRYRVEVAGTQSEWFAVTVVQQIKLADLSVTITPPAYTKLALQTIAIKPDAASPVAIPQGSHVQITAATDVPVASALLQLATRNNPAAPAAMDRVGQTQRFTGKTSLLDDATAAILITDSSGNIAATLPDPPLTLSATKDAPPHVEIKSPMADATLPPAADVSVKGQLVDDFGIASYRVLMAVGADAPLQPILSKTLGEPQKTVDLDVPLKLDAAATKDGQSIRVQVEATDTRDLTTYSADLGPQTTQSPVIEVKFRDKELADKQKQELTDKLRAILMAMLKSQTDLNNQAAAWKDGDTASLKKIGAGQMSLRDDMAHTAETFAFDDSTQIVKRTLQVLAINPAKEAIDLAAQMQAAATPPDRAKLNQQLQSDQRRVISSLQSLLALLAPNADPATQPADKRGGDMNYKKEEVAKLDEALKKYMEQQRKLLDQTAGLAKRPVDQWTDADKKLADQLAMSQEKLDAFMQETVADFSKLAEQDMSNASMLKDAVAIYSETTMAKDALKKQAEEIAVPAEENGIESAKELEANLQRWLSDTPDRAAWKQEDLPQKNDAPLPELPKELEDMVGELMEQQEDLFDQMEDQNANIHDSADKGIGWDAADGPIADMSAKGVTGNQLPNNNEMDGRSGEGRSGKSEGEFVGDNAVGKGGRNTPTRLDPTAFQQGQIKDTSKDPVGGATGGGKVSGEGGAGLEGPVPDKVQQTMQRLAQKQAELRNKAERLNLQYQLGRYDNFKLLEATVLMRKVENDLNANRYSNAMRRKDILLDSLDTSQLLLGGEVHVQEDSTPTVSQKQQQDVNDAMSGELPPAWSDALKQYYSALGTK